MPQKKDAHHVCEWCYKDHPSRQAKYKHKQNHCFCKPYDTQATPTQAVTVGDAPYANNPSAATSTQAGNHNNASTSSNTNQSHNTTQDSHNTVTITVTKPIITMNVFGYEDNSYLTDNDYIRYLSMPSISDAIQSMIKDIYCNPLHPENHTVFIGPWPMVSTYTVRRMSCVWGRDELTRALRQVVNDTCLNLGNAWHTRPALREIVSKDKLFNGLSQVRIMQAELNRTLTTLRKHQSILHSPHPCKPPFPKLNKERSRRDT